MVASPYADDAVPGINSKVVERKQKKKQSDSDYEKQVSMARKERRGVDSKVQMLLNRISYLKAEEAKLDRDFIRTQKRTEEMLLMKADRASDIDIYEAARDVLENLHKGLSGKEAAGRSPSGRRASAGKDTSDKGHPIPQAYTTTVPLEAHSPTPSARASRRSSSSSSGCCAIHAPPPPLPPQGRRSSLSSPAANAPLQTSRSLSRSASDSGPQRRRSSSAQQPQPQPPQQQQQQDASSNSSSSVQQQQQQQQQSSKPPVPARRPPSALRRATSSDSTRCSSVPIEQQRPPGRQPSGALSASEDQTTAASQAVQGYAATANMQAGVCVAGPCEEDLTHPSSRSSLSQGEHAHRCCQDSSLRWGSCSNSNDGSSTCSSASCAKGWGSGRLRLLQPAVPSEAGDRSDANGRVAQQSVLLPPEAACCPEEIDDVSAQAQAHGAANHMQLLSQGVAAEVPDADELEEGGGSSAAGPVHHTPPRLAGLHTFSTQEVPRVVHTVASAPKESPAYVPGHSVTVHGHAGTAHGHAVMGVGWGMGAIRLGASGHAGDQQQHQQERAAASAAPSKALRPTSSLGRNSRSTKASGSGGGATDDIQQRQQIWALRRTFGLAPTVMHDSTAHLEECGAGAWK